MRSVPCFQEMDIYHKRTREGSVDSCKNLVNELLSSKWFCFKVRCLTFFDITQIVEALSTSYLGPDYSQVLCTLQFTVCIMGCMICYHPWLLGVQTNTDEFCMLVLQPREFTDIFLKDIDQVAKSSFPLCMRHLFDKVKFVATGVGVIPVYTVG